MVNGPRLLKPHDRSRATVAVAQALVLGYSAAIVSQ